ncbi:hypothetical protein OHB12_31980 [Nocardia sp. NBC_01730]|uniref:hypothetical protein n=1 Tax=Nocardia sp. NBC_01730 TaxID=2975998 RepID=UPI002E120BAD|nr:hypothetical protein OHB12_31980 [Nocardia sp. NBC_01730]
MALPTAVSPEHLQATSAQMCVNQATITSVVVGAAPATCPLPAAFDDASCIAAEKFNEYSVTKFLNGTAVGLTNLLSGADLLVPVSAEYLTTDIADGSVVRACQPL